MSKLRSALASVCVTPLLAFGLMAQELPSEGKLSVTYTGVITSPLKPIVFGLEREVIVGAPIMTAVNDAGSGLLHNMAGRCFLVTIIDRAKKELEAKGYCNYADRSGDQIYEEVTTAGAIPLGTPVKYVGKLNGGTGKFAGLSGDIEITNSGNFGPEGIFQATGKKTGTYKINK